MVVASRAWSATTSSTAAGVRDVLAARAGLARRRRRARHRARAAVGQPRRAAGPRAGRGPPRAARAGRPHDRAARPGAAPAALPRLRRRRRRRRSPASWRRTACPGSTAAWVGHRRARRADRWSGLGAGAALVAAGAAPAALGWRRSSASALLVARRRSTAPTVIAVQPHRALRAARAVAAALRRRSGSCRWWWPPPSSLVGPGRSSGTVSLEAAERRSTLVGQLRFAATLQDLRTVVRAAPPARPRAAPPPALAAAAGAGQRPAARRSSAGCAACCAGPRRAWRGSCLLGRRGRRCAARRLGRHHAARRAGRAGDVRGRARRRRAAGPGGRPPEPARRLAAASRGTIHLRHVPVGVLVLAAHRRGGRGGRGGRPAGRPARCRRGGRRGVGAARSRSAASAGALVSVLAGPSPIERGLGARPARGAGHAPGVPHRVAARHRRARRRCRSSRPAPPWTTADPGAGGRAGRGRRRRSRCSSLVCGWVRVRDEIAAWWRSQMEQALSPEAERDRPCLTRSSWPTGRPRPTPTSSPSQPLDLARAARARSVALVGHNGSGKSTFLRLAAGLLDLTDGTIDDRRARRPARPSARAAVSFLPDEPVLYDDLSVREHLAYVAALHGVDLSERPRRPRRAGRPRHRADDLPSQFSRGLRQRTSIALGLVRPFELLLVDEPFVGLDLGGQGGAARHLRRAARRRRHHRGRHPRPLLRRAGRPLRRPARRRGRPRRPGHPRRGRPARLDLTPSSS